MGILTLLTTHYTCWHVRQQPLVWQVLAPWTALAFSPLIPLSAHRLVGLVVKASTSRAEDPGFKSRLRQDFSVVESYQWLKNWHSSGYPARRLAWRYRVSTGTGWPGVSILWLGKMESLVYNFYLSVAARKVVWADPSLRYTRMLLGR